MNSINIFTVWLVQAFQSHHSNRGIPQFGENVENDFRHRVRVQKQRGGIMRRLSSVSSVS